eukprot:4087666-Heterocapsa_arctica.AAC.1
MDACATMNIIVVISARVWEYSKGRPLSKGMEEDDMEDVLPADWRRQRAEDNFILANQNVYPTTDGDDDQGGGVDDQRGEERLQGLQICQESTRTSLLESMLSCKLLRMLFQDECGGGPDDERHQRRNGSGKWAHTQAKIEHIAIFLATRPNQRKRLSRLGAVRLSREEARTIIMRKKKAFNFFATVAVKKIVYVDDIMIPVDQENMPYASAFELFLECGNDHISRTFDMLMAMLNADRNLPDHNILREINCTTKANINQSIPGLGHIFRQQRHPELADLPDI